MKRITLVVTEKQAAYLLRWAIEAETSADTQTVMRDAERLVLRIQKAVAAAQEPPQ